MSTWNTTGRLRLLNAPGELGDSIRLNVVRFGGSSGFSGDALRSSVAAESAGGPGDPVGVEQHTELVVIEVREPASGALDLLGAEVHAFGRSVRCPGSMMVQDLGAPARQGVRQRSDLGCLVVRAGLDSVVEEGDGLVHVVGELDPPHGFLLASQAPSTSS